MMDTCAKCNIKREAHESWRLYVTHEDPYYNIKTQQDLEQYAVMLCENCGKLLHIERHKTFLEFLNSRSNELVTVVKPREYDVRYDAFKGDKDFSFTRDEILYLCDRINRCCCISKNVDNGSIPLNRAFIFALSLREQHECNTKYMDGYF